MPRNTDALQPTAAARSEFAGRRVTVMGLGQFGGGISVVRFLAGCGAQVTVTDLASRAQLTTSLNALADVDVAEYVFEEHPRRVLTDCDVLVVNPAVRPDHMLVQQATAGGLRITSEIELFCRYCRAEIIGITGSNGKSTTAALTHHLLHHGRPGDRGRAWLGGNIGISLLSQLDAIAARDIVVLELSSFQLARLATVRFRPRVAVVTNFSPNHLDWHGTVDHYRTAKQAILAAQLRDDAAVLPDSFDTAGWRPRGSVWRFGLSDEGEPGGQWDGDTLILRGPQRPDDWFATPPVPSAVGRPGARSGRTGGMIEEAIRVSLPTTLTGPHNRRNVAAAACAAWLGGMDASTVPDALRSFTGLPHRLRNVAEHRGRRFIDDSLATTPESVIAALETLSRPVVLLAGGYDKGACLDQMAESIARRAKAVVLMGQTAAGLQRAVLAAPAGTCGAVHCGKDFPDTFRQAVALSEPGDIVLLSPGCASFGWFRDFRDRGEQFISLVHQWMSDT